MSVGRSPRWQRVLIHAILIVFTVLTLYPILLVFGISLRPGDQLYSTSLRPIPEDATLAAYRIILFEKSFLLWLRNSAIVSLP